MPSSEQGSWLRDAVRALCSVVVLLAIFEFGLRLAGVHFEASLYTIEKERDFSLRPNAQGWETSETDNYVKINSQGMNDREYTLARPADVIRIAVIGSSEVAAFQVPREQSFEAVLQRDLSQATGRKIEVMNFGVPGYNLSHQYLTLKNHVFQYDPQIVIVAMSLTSVIMNVRSLGSGRQPFFAYQNGKLDIDEGSRQIPEPDPKRLRWKNMSSDVMNKSELLSLLNYARIGLNRRIDELRPADKAAAADAAQQREVSVVWPYLPTRDPQFPVDPRLLESWRIAEGLLKMMRDETVKHHAEFWMVPLDMAMQTDPNPQVREAFRTSHHLPSLVESDKRFADFAREEHMHSLMLTPLLMQYAQEHKVYLHGFAQSGFAGGHWNQVGHKIAGDILAAELLRNSETLRAHWKPI